MKKLHIYILIWFAGSSFFNVKLKAQNQDIRVHKYNYGEGITFSNKHGYEWKLQSYIQPYAELKYLQDTSFDQTLFRFRMRRLRFRIDGTSPSKKWEYRVQYDFSGSSEVEENNKLYLMDAFVTYNAGKKLSITFGQRSNPADLRLYSSNAIQLVERSRLVSAFSTIREFGFFAQSSFKFKNSHYIRPYIAITNGDGGNVMRNDFGGLKYSARVDYLPFGLFRQYGQFREADVFREPTPKLVIGAFANTNRGMSSRRGRESGTILYLDQIGNYSLPNYSKIGIDLLFKYKGFSFLADAIHATATVPESIAYRVREDGSVANTFLVDGLQNVDAYVKGRMMLGTGYNLQSGYIFPSGISIDGQFTRFINAPYTFLKNGTFYNRPQYVTIGMSKYFGRNYQCKYQISATHVTCDPGSNYINSQPMNGNEWIFRFQTTFSL
jgi:hypothetical protein